MDLTAEDVTFSFFYDMNEISFSMPFSSVSDPSGVPHSVSSLTGTDETAPALSVSKVACPACTSFAVRFQYTFPERPPAEVAIVAPVLFGMRELEGDMLLDGMVSVGFIGYYFLAGVGLSPLSIWIELDLALREVAAPPSDVVELREGSAVELYQVEVVDGVAQPPEPLQEPVAVSDLSGSVESQRESSIWTVIGVAMAADDVTIRAIPLTDLGLTMPFIDVPDASGTAQSKLILTGIDDGSLLIFDEDEPTCPQCTDFAVSFNYTLASDDPVSIALIGPLELALGEEGGHTTLGGTLEHGFVLGSPPFEIGLWLLGELDFIAVPEPSLLLIQSMALLAIGLLAVPHRLRRGATRSS